MTEQEVQALIAAALAKQKAEFEQKLAETEQKLADVNSHIKALHENQSPEKVNDTLRSYARNAFQVESAEVYSIDHRTDKFFTTDGGEKQYLSSAQDERVGAEIRGAIESGELTVNENPPPHTLIPIKDDSDNVI
ncbi:hypothetical protein AGMMS49975_28890 [Clostridia bacterium]|nr:hypothetical protein AGMMS49975_28890 [Clostridia bacterium]